MESLDVMEKEFGKCKMRTKDQGRRAEERIGTILAELHEEALIVFIGSAAQGMEGWSGCGYCISSDKQGIIRTRKRRSGKDQ